MPKPNQGESREDFVQRCIPVVIEDGTAEDGSQANAICNSMYKEENMGKIKDYHNLPGFETKTIPTFIKSIDEDLGIVEQVISVFGVIDDGNDIVEPGSFTKTILEHGSRVKVLDQHRTDSVLRVVGKPLSMMEIPRNLLPPEVLVKFPEATGGLLVKTQYALDTENGKDVFKLIQGGFLPETSFGYDALDTQMVRRNVNGKDQAVRLLKTLRLWEYSNVIWGMNPATATISAKDKTGGDIMDENVSNDELLDKDEKEEKEPVQEEQNQETDSDKETCEVCGEKGFVKVFDIKYVDVVGSDTLEVVHIDAGHTLCEKHNRPSIGIMPDGTIDYDYDSDYHTKAGRRVSQRDEASLRGIVEGLQSAIDSINGMFPVVEDEEEETMELNDELNTLTVEKEKVVNHFTFNFSENVDAKEILALFEEMIQRTEPKEEKQTEQETDEAGPIDESPESDTKESPTTPEVKDMFDFDNALLELKDLEKEIMEVQ
jgi:HK97 family phage prohead protease